MKKYIDARGCERSGAMRESVWTRIPWVTVSDMGGAFRRARADAAPSYTADGADLGAFCCGRPRRSRGPRGLGLREAVAWRSSDRGQVQARALPGSYLTWPARSG